MITTTLAVSGAALYVGNRKRFWQRKPKKLAEMFRPENGTNLQPFRDDTQKTARHLALSAGMLGLTTLGHLAFPLLGLATLPVLLYLNLPFLRTGRKELAEEGRAGIGVLDSAASLGMLALGNFFADALFLSLYFLSLKLIDKTKDQMQKTEDLTDGSGNLAERKLQGERLVDYGSLPMLALGVVTLPLLGAQQAVAVLVNYFGFDLRVVAPLSVLSYLQLAARSGILVRDGRALEALQKGDLVFVLDEAALAKPEAQRVVDILIGRGLSVVEASQYPTTAEQALPCASLPADEHICFVGATFDSPLAAQAEVVVSWDSTLAAAEDATHIVLMQNDLTQLVDLLDLAGALERNIKTSIVITAVPAVACLAGIYFLNFGIVTAIVLDYAGLGLGALYAISPRVIDSMTARLQPARAQTSLAI